MCESNTPGRLFTPHYGFEDRARHQPRSGSVGQDSGLWPVAPRVPASAPWAEDADIAISLRDALLVEVLEQRHDELATGPDKVARVFGQD